MNKREKLLALIVSLLVTVQVVFWGVSSIQKSFRSRRTAKLAIQEKMNGQDLKIQRARSATVDVQSYESRSLPSDLEIARAEYETWLAQLLAKAGIAEPQFKCKSTPVRKGSDPVTITWSVSGSGSLEQVTELLYDYYGLDTLHRMSSLKLTSAPNNRQLQVNFDTQAFVLANTAADSKLDPSRKSAWAQEHGREDITQIVQRNMLARANIPPRLARLRPQNVQLGETFEMEIKAEDANPDDQLRFVLVEPPEGARIDPRSGQLKWRPTSVGEYTFIARVDDDGIPTRSSMQEFAVTVLPAPPPPAPEPPKPAPPKVDEAMFTFVTGNVRVNGKPQVWLKVRTSGQTLKLTEGDAIQVGSIDGIVSKINERSFELTMGDTRREIQRGQPLVARPL